METNTYYLSEIAEICDSRRIPLSAMERVKRHGKYRYYGAQGVIDYVDDFLFDGEYLLIAEDGENLKSLKQNIAQVVTGKFWVNNHAHIIQTNSKCRLRYLYYLINSMNISGYITGSAQPKLSQANMKKIELELPSVLMQDKILSVLGTIDDKIENNKKINKNLEQQAIALYKANFIDFVPYDGKMPSSWRQGTVSEIIEIHDSKRIPLSNRERSDLDKIYPYYGATSIMDYVDKYLFDGIYLLLAEDGTVMDDRGYPILQYVEGKFWVNNHAHILTGKNGYTVELLYLLFKLTNVKSIITGAVQLKISQANLRNLSVVIPTQADLREIDAIIQPLFSEIRNLRAENQRLSAIRDSLLPKLMSGELDISEVDI